MKFDITAGVFTPDFELSELERTLFRDFEGRLRSRDFQYLAVPEAVKTEVLYRQGVASNEMAYWLDGNHFLNGSAEQGILCYFMDKRTDPCRIYSETRCFRREPSLEGPVRLKEFRKLEQYVFCLEPDWTSEFELVLDNATEFLNFYGIQNRVVDATTRDPGYHIKKFDIEINTKKYGWVETHSCTYFGTEQTKRFGITGAEHTISNTGIASPRILIPFIERTEK